MSVAHVQFRIMESNESGGHTPLVRRRAFLTALGVGTAASLAGCEEITNQSFEASAVGLSTGAQETLHLSELAQETLRFEESAADGNVSVSITSHTAVYSRAAALGGL